MLNLVVLYKFSNTYIVLACFGLQDLL
jgi:hypothetical protein